MCSGSFGRALDWNEGLLVRDLPTGSHCVVSLSKTFYPLLSTCSNQEVGNCSDMTENCSLGCKAPKQINKTSVGGYIIQFSVNED